jgi:hypothetical protein
MLWCWAMPFILGCSGENHTIKTFSSESLAKAIIKRVNP